MSSLSPDDQPRPKNSFITGEDGKRLNTTWPCCKMYLLSWHQTDLVE